MPMPPVIDPNHSLVWVGKDKDIKEGVWASDPKSEYSRSRCSLQLLKSLPLPGL